MIAAMRAHGLRRLVLRDVDRHQRRTRRGRDVHVLEDHRADPVEDGTHRLRGHGADGEGGGGQRPGLDGHPPGRPLRRRRRDRLPGRAAPAPRPVHLPHRPGRPAVREATEGLPSASSSTWSTTTGAPTFAQMFIGRRCTSASDAPAPPGGLPDALRPGQPLRPRGRCRHHLDHLRRGFQARVHSPPRREEAGCCWTRT